jgi:hypothetical protein
MLQDPATVAKPVSVVVPGAVMPSRSQVVAALALGSVALLILGLQPLLLGELVAQQRISLGGVGLVAMGEIVALGVGVILPTRCCPLPGCQPSRRWQPFCSRFWTC